MKRFFFSAIALMVAATACTESGLIDTPDMYGSAIVFDTYLGKTPVTKAQNMGIDNLKSSYDDKGGAHLYSFMSTDNVVDYTSAFMNGNLGWDSSKSVWNYQISSDEGKTWETEEVYWPGDVDLVFAAYNLAADDCITGRSLTGFDFTVQDDIADQVDLLATPLTLVRESVNSDTSVGLTFYHLLSRVGFSVIATDPSDQVSITIQSLRLCGVFPKKGKVDLTASTSRPSIEAYTTDKATGYDLFATGEYCTKVTSVCGSTATEDSRIFADNGEKDERFMMLMPGQLDGAKIEVMYQLSGADPQFGTVDLGNIHLKAGCAYEFVLEVATSAIKFSGVVEGDWDEQPDTDIP